MNRVGTFLWFDNMIMLYIPIGSIAVFFGGYVEPRPWKECQLVNGHCFLGRGIIVSMLIDWYVFC